MGFWFQELASAKDVFDNERFLDVIIPFHGREFVERNKGYDACYA